MPMSLLTFERSRSKFKVICFEKDPPVTDMKNSNLGVKRSKVKNSRSRWNMLDTVVFYGRRHIVYIDGWHRAKSAYSLMGRILHNNKPTFHNSVQ